MRRVRTVALLGFAMVPLSCGMSEEKFTDEIVDAVCEYYEQCLAAYFNEYYDDLQECREGFAEYVSTDYYAENCEFDDKKAKDCLRAMRDATDDCDYEKFYDDACDDVWDCGGGGGTRDTG